MRNPIITALTITALFGAVACTKYRPDHDLVDCQRVNFYAQAFADSSLRIPLTDPVLNWPQNGGDNLLCGEELKKDLKGLPRFSGLCDVDGTKYYIYYFYKLQ